MLRQTTPLQQVGLVISHPGVTAHTGGDAYVYYPSEEILISGDTALDNLTRPGTSVGPFYTKESKGAMLRTVRISLRTVEKLHGLG